MHGQVNSIVAIEERLIVQLGFQVFDGGDPLNNVSLVEPFLITRLRIIWHDEYDVGFADLHELVFFRIELHPLVAFEYE